MGSLCRHIFGISVEETSFERRGFRGEEPVRSHLEAVGASFLSGYHDALEESRPWLLSILLGRVPRELQGFAYEGAAMALALLDALTPWRRDRLAAVLDGPGHRHVYMMHVGAGWAVARLPPLRRTILGRLDPLFSWLAFDGYGFHEGYFHADRGVRRREVPRWLAGYARNAFDQGLGRSLWFIEGGDVRRIAAAVADFPAERRGDLWSGVGLACAYAGGVERASIHSLARLGAEHARELAQGAAFAAEARQRAGNPTAHTEMACGILCGTSARRAAAATLEAYEDLPEDGEIPAYEIWRRRISERLAAERRAA